MTAARDQQLHQDAAAALRPGPNTPAERRRASLTICDLAGSADDALAPMAALGLIDPLTPLPDCPVGPNLRKHTQAVRHGTAAGVRWHKTTRVPPCSACRAWGTRNAEGAS